MPVGLCACVFRSRAYLRNHTSKLHQIYVHVGLCLGPPRNTLCTSRFVNGVIFAHNRRGKNDANELKLTQPWQHRTGGEYDTYDCLV